MRSQAETIRLERYHLLINILITAPISLSTKVPPEIITIKFYMNVENIVKKCLSNTNLKDLALRLDNMRQQKM